MKYNETIFLCYQWKHTKRGHALFSALSADYVKFPWPIRGKNENFPALEAGWLYSSIHNLFTDVTFGHYDRFALCRFWEVFLKNRLITPHTDATALHYHPTVISFECNRQIPHSAFLSILLKTTSIYFCQEPGNRANERVSIY